MPATTTSSSSSFPADPLFPKLFFGVMDSPPVKRDTWKDTTRLQDTPAFLCCCSFLDETLGPRQHLPDCELELLTENISLPDGISANEDCKDTSGLETRKRKHRESMTRLRKKLRDSIDTLQLEERRLTRSLQHAVDNFQPHPSPSQSSAASSVDTKRTQQQAYYELVKEQLALQEERRNLNETWAQKIKFERLVRREIDRELDRVSEVVDQDGNPYTYEQTNIFDN